jgi:hypothetical protein
MSIDWEAVAKHHERVLAGIQQRFGPLVSENEALKIRVAELEARAEKVRTTDCFADHPVCQCCVEMVYALFPEPLSEGALFTVAVGNEGTPNE